MSQSRPKPFKNVQQSLPKPYKTLESRQSLPKPPRASQSLTIPPKASQSLTKPQGARTNGKSTEKHETFVPSIHFETRKYDIPIKSNLTSLSPNTVKTRHSHKRLSENSVKLHANLNSPQKLPATQCTAYAKNHTNIYKLHTKHEIGDSWEQK